LGNTHVSLALRSGVTDLCAAAGTVAVLDAACFIGGRHQGVGGSSLCVVQRAT
jgi:hypothetical protein